MSSQNICFYRELRRIFITYPSYLGYVGLKRFGLFFYCIKYVINLVLPSGMVVRPKVYVGPKLFIKTLCISKAMLLLFCA